MTRCENGSHLASELIVGLNSWRTSEHTIRRSNWIDKLNIINPANYRRIKPHCTFVAKLIPLAWNAQAGPTPSIDLKRRSLADDNGPSLSKV